jgi:hypothetical protein
VFQEREEKPTTAAHWFQYQAFHPAKEVTIIGKFVRRRTGISSVVESRTEFFIVVDHILPPAPNCLLK